MTQKYWLHDSLFENWNNYHEKFKFTNETNSKKFLDTRLLLENDTIKSEVYCKANKFPIHWKLQILKRYKKKKQYMETYFVHGESTSIFIIRKTK